MPSIRMGPAGAGGSTVVAVVPVNCSGLGDSVLGDSLLDGSAPDGSAADCSAFFTTFVCTVVEESAPIMSGIGPVGSGSAGAIG